MKRTIFTRLSAVSTVASLAMAAMASCGAKSSVAVVDGTVTGIEDGTRVWLLDLEQKAKDSTTVAGGKFRFEIAEVYPDFNIVRFDGTRSGGIPLFTEPGTIAIEANFEGENPTYASITGTPTNDTKKAIDDDVTANFQARLDEINSALDAMLAAGEQGTPDYKNLLFAYFDVEDEQEQYRMNAVMENPDTVLAAWYAFRESYSMTTPEGVDSLLNAIAGAPANAFTDRLKERRDVLAKIAENVEAPDFTQNMPDGTPFTLSSLRGKLVLIDFWASWCGPCRDENPNVVKVYDRFKDNGFEIVGVSLDDSREAWLHGIEEDGLPWIHVSDLKGWRNAVAEQYAVRSIPHTVLVGPDGVIIAKNLRGKALESKIAEVLGVR